MLSTCCENEKVFSLFASCLQMFFLFCFFLVSCQLLVLLFTLLSFITCPLWPCCNRQFLLTELWKVLTSPVTTDQWLCSTKPQTLYCSSSHYSSQNIPHHTLCMCVCMWECICQWVCVSVCSLISHFSYLMSVVSQTAGPISRELRHDSDLCRLVAGGCDSEWKGAGGGRGEGKGR